MPTGNTAANPPARNRTRLLRTILIAMGLVVVPLGIYVVAELQPQREHMTQRNYRVLAETGRELLNQIARIKPLIAFSQIPDGQTSKLDELQAEIDRAKKKPAITSKEEKKKEGEIKAAEAVKSYVEGLRKTPEYRAIEIDAEGACRFDPGADPSHELVGRHAPLELQSTGCRRIAGSNGTGIHVRLPFSDLADPLDVASRAAFDQLVIASEDGRVLHYSRSGPVRELDQLLKLLADAEPSGSLIRLRRITGSKDDAANSRDTVLERARRHPLEVEIAQRWYRVYAQPIEVPASLGTTDSTGSAASSVSGSTSSPATKSASSTLYLVGIVADSRFAADAFASSRSDLTLGIAGFVLLVLAWPWLRLVFSGPRERISIRMVVELLASLGLAVGLVTLMVFDVVTGRALDATLDATARDIGERIEWAMRDEIKRSVENLQDSASEVCSHPMPPPESKGGDRSAVHHPDWPRDHSLGGSPYIYPPFDLAFALDDKGSQVGHQVTYRAGEVRTIRVPGREYFVRARDRNLWTMEESEHPFFLQRIRTYDHGWRLTVVSSSVRNSATGEEYQPLPCGEVGNSPLHAVAAAMTRRFDSLTSVVLPPAFGFAILEDASGDVFFHSDDSRSLVENFYAEIGADSRLQTLVASRRSESLSGHYRSHGLHRFTVRPLRDLPWTLVIFRRANVYDLLNFELLVSSGILLVAYVLVVALIGGALGLAFPNSRWSWIWPAADRGPKYRAAAAFCALMTVLSGYAILWLQGAWLLLVVALGPATLGPLYLSLRTSQTTSPWSPVAARTAAAMGWLGVLVIVYQVAGPDDDGAFRAIVILVLALLAGIAARALETTPTEHGAAWQRPGIWYFAMLLGVLGVVVAAPTVAIFKDAQRAQLDRITRRGQQIVARAMHTRESALWADAGRLKPDPFEDLDSRDDIVRSKEARGDGVYVTASLLVTPEATPSRSDDLLSGMTPMKPACNDQADYDWAFSTPILRRLPYYSATALELRQGLHGRSHDGSECWPWTPADRGGRLAYQGSGWQILSSRLRIPRPGTEDQWGVAMLGVGVAILAAAIMLRLLGTRVLGLLIEVPPSPPKLDGATDLLRHGGLLLASPPGWMRSAIDTLRRSGHPVHHCVMAEREDADPGPVPNDARLIVIEDLHVCLPDPTRRARALDRVEALVRGTALPVWITSALHPLDCLPADPGASRAEQEVEQLRWASLLTGLPTARAPLAKPSREIAEALDEAPPERREALERECGWSPSLLEIRDEIASDPRFASGVFSEAQIVDWVTRRGRAVFQREWLLTLPEDRLALIHAAEGDLVNPRNRVTIDRLLRRGLLIRQPQLKPVSESLTGFITAAESREQIRDWEASAAGGTWSVLRWPLIILLGLIAGFAIYASRETLDATAMFVPMVLAGLPIVLRIMSSTRIAGRTAGGDDSPFA